MDLQEVRIKSRNKISWLYMNSVFEKRIEEFNECGKIQYLFVFEATDRLEELLKEYRDNEFLRNYNKSFQNVNLSITKLKSNSEIKNYD